MPKSKYPEQLDTSVEIPPVRDNITEIGSDVINSLRSAIFQIERTLGINPQGAVGNSLAGRLNKALDDNGNILEDALDRANVLSGPILDVDVSRVAAIQESKLKLDFPTTLLQDEISILNGEIDNIISQVEELSLSLSIHLNPSSTNRHSALAISVAEADVESSDIATLNLIAGTLQDTLELLYNAHINYSGLNISSLNNSHLASQVFFNNEEISDIVFSESVQGAIEDLASIESVGFRNALLNLHSNGRIRTGSVQDAFEGNQIGSIILSSSEASYIQAAGNSRTLFTLNSPAVISETINEFDILTMSGASNDNDNKEYQISEVNLDGSGNLISIEVYGGPVSTFLSGIFITVSKNQNVAYNEAGFASAVRPRSDRTNTPDVQIANPDSATLISTGIRPESLTAIANTFDISIDGGATVTIETYDSTVSRQTINSVINKVNEQFVDLHLNVTAYKVKSTNCYEMALVHNVPNFSGDGVNRTIELSAGTSNDGTSILGLGSILNTEVEGASGNSININGLILSKFGLINQFSNSTIEIVTGSLAISLFSGTLSELGVRVGDIVVVDGSDNPLDDGSYRIESITGGVADLDLAGSSFLGALSDDGQILIIRSTAPIGELTFTEISSVDGTIVFDTFMTEDKDIHYTKRMEVDGTLSDGPFIASVVDISRNFITSEETGAINVNTSGFATLTGPDLTVGEPVFVGATGTYKLFAADRLSFVTIEFNATGAPIVAQQVSLFGFDEVGGGNYVLSRGSFSTALGRILGESVEPGIPVMISKLRSGTVDTTIISESVIEKYIEGPRNELRASGVVRGCEVSGAIYDGSGSPIFQTFDVSAGIIVVNGVRYEFPGLEGFRINTGNTFYVAVNAFGCVIAEEITTHPDTLAPVSPFFDQEVATLAVITNDTIVATITDLRLFIDNLDYKLISDISVSPDQRFGHFTDIKKAVDYARRFTEMFPDMEEPTIFIKEGSHSVSEQIIIDFNLTIDGAGPNSLITKTGSFAEGSALVGDDVDMSTAVFLIGESQSASTDNINRGVDIRNILYQTSDSITNVGCFIAITQGVATHPNNNFSFENIRMLGPSTIDGAAADPNKIGEYFLVLGRQDPGTLVPEAGVTVGNLTVNNCRFRRVGLEMGVIKVLESSGGTFRNSSIYGNISVGSSPNLNNTDNVIIEYPDPLNVSLEEVVETANIRRV